jgi:hypothetical protein
VAALVCVEDFESTALRRGLVGKAVLLLVLVQEHEQQQQWLGRVLCLWIPRRLFCRKPISPWRHMQPWSVLSKAERRPPFPCEASQLRLAINAWGAWVTVRLTRHSSKCHLQHEHVVSVASVIFSYIAGAETAH